MSKYYILAENTRVGWAIFVNKYENWYLFTPHRIDRTCTEDNLIRSPISPVGSPYSDKEFANAKAILIKKGMPYGVAIDSVKKANDYQKVELKRVRHQYVNEHTVAFSVISENKALKLIKSLPLKRWKTEGDPVKVNPNSLEGRRWRKNLRNIKSIWKDWKHD